MSVWEDDLLGFQEVGNTFGNLIKSIDDSKVISIEAGYGRGKTFFRERWAQHLKAEGEVVVEVDALLSDLTGDPVLTFIAALVGALPESETSTGKKLVENSRKFGGLAARSALRLALRQGAEEIIDLATNKAVDALGESEKALQEAAQEFGDGLSKSAGDLIASQVAAERLRTVELPEQLKTLRDALTKDKEHKRVVILVDELDRCHPDYAIAFLEAMKLVFGQDGFVFCLFVNADYLQTVADHRFGQLQVGEQYLDKFVDIRLRLPVDDNDLGAATKQIALFEMDLAIPFGEGNQFSVEHAADLAAKLALLLELTPRQIRRILRKVGLTLRCYSDRPVDASMLVYLAFQSKEAGQRLKHTSSSTHLPRAFLTPAVGKRISQAAMGSFERDLVCEDDRKLKRECPELFDLPRERYPLPNDGRDYFSWAKLKALAVHYIPSHQDMLDAVHSFEVET